jgi:hypothetical protein
MRARSRHFVPLLVVGCAAAAAAHVRLIYSGNGNALFWSNPGSISVVINDQGTDDVNDGTDEVACRAAILAWNDVVGTSATLVENQAAAQQARTDWATDSLHLLFFDETNSTGYFPSGSGVVALTPITFFTSGQIIDADILFNGGTFHFTTNGTPGRFDIQDVATHELGHLLGLDHSGWAGATMYPYVDPTVILHRSLSLDDVHGLQHMYPSASFGSITGNVQRSSDGSNVAGVHVVAVDSSGRAAGASLTGVLGNYTLHALATDTYDVYAVPLDDPVSASNLSAGHTIETDFEAGLLGTIATSAGVSADLGTRTVDPDVSLSLGRVADDYPLRVISGQTVTRTVRGSGLVAGCSLTCSDPSLTVTPSSWIGGAVQFDVSVPPGAAPGHVNLTVTNVLGEEDVLVAGLEITPPDPVVALVAPATGSADGGDSVTLNGSGFRPGLRVVIGDRVYSDGSTATVVDPSTITLNTFSMVGGLHDVVVIDPSGVEGRLVDGFQAQASPVIESTFPSVGAAAGGTSVVLTGSDFVPGAFVTIDGQLQGAVVNGTSKLTVTTSGGVPGGPYVLTVQNPGGETAMSSFVYVAAPDPVVDAVSPGSGPQDGGQLITISGSGFSADTRVRFGANAATGAGGVPAAQVTLVDESTLHVVTPASSSSAGSVLVRDAVTQQASVLTSAYTFQGGGDDGGGGCAAIAPAGPATWRRALSGAGWVLVLGVLLGWRGRRRLVIA